MLIPRKFLFQNDKTTFIRFSASITRIILLRSLCFDIKQSAYAWTEVVLSDSLPEWRGYNNFLFHNHISCLMFPADARRRFSPLPVERSVRVSSRSVREPITSSEDWLCIPISAVHVLTRVTDGDHHHSTEVVIIGGATWKLNRPVNSRWDYRIQIPLSNM